MSCEDHIELLTGFVDEELSPAEETLVKKHLAECAACTKEVEEIREFNRQMHNETVSFRQATSRIESAVLREIQEKPAPFKLRRFLQPAWIAAAFVLLFLLGYQLLQTPNDQDRLIAWGVEHYALVDQVHPVSGNAETVRQWFQTHHQISVQPPQRVDYSHLTGCKMAELDSHPAPLLRFEEKGPKAVFILPSKSVKAGTRVANGFQFEFWTEGSRAYMAMSRLNS